MKKIISLIICAVVLCAFSVTAFADDDDLRMSYAIEWIGYAEEELDRCDYVSAALYYASAAGCFKFLDQKKGWDIAYYLYGRAAEYYEENNKDPFYYNPAYTHDAENAREDQEFIARYKGDAVCIPVSDYFDVNGRLKPNVSASTLSEGNIAIIVGVASAFVFGAAGLIAGKAIGKKKALATKGKETN